MLMSRRNRCQYRPFTHPPRVERSSLSSAVEFSVHLVQRAIHVFQDIMEPKPIKPSFLEPWKNFAHIIASFSVLEEDHVTNFCRLLELLLSPWTSHRIVSFEPGSASLAEVFAKRPSTSESTKASSRPWAAPAAWYGKEACALSPSRATRPR
jgi:hypothetical protein